MSEKWNDEEWMEFTEVITEEAGGLTSFHEAERTLRKLCASGVVRAICVTEDGPKVIAPKEWTRDDFGTVEVYLSCNDLHQHWLDLENRPPPKPTGKQPRIKAHLAQMFPNGVRSEEHTSEL